MRIGIDLGGTKISGILLSPDGKIISRTRIDSPKGDYRASLNAIRDMANHLAGPDGTDIPVGIGIPGTISPKSGLVKNANSTWLIGHPLDKDLEQITGRKVRLANDADCFALSEASDGAGSPFETVFGVILGTGVGGGFVINGTLLRGPNAIAGEWGHNPLPWADPIQDPAQPCYCGKSGCIETYLSGPGLSVHHGINACETLPATVIGKAETSERRATIEVYCGRLARALAHVINILDPDCIVLGGGVSGIERIYDAVPLLWGGYVFSDSVETTLLKNHHGADSGVRGAAWLWPGET